jgi:hypothetical protein
MCEFCENPPTPEMWAEICRSLGWEPIPGTERPPLNLAYCLPIFPSRRRIIAPDLRLELECHVGDTDPLKSLARE